MERPFLADTLAGDSTALRLAVTPTMGNLPFYYARYAGIYKDLGLKLSFRCYDGQLDCDSALLGGSTDGATTDLVRLHEYSHWHPVLTGIMSYPEHWHLLSSAKLRAKKMASLKARTVGIARLSASEYYAKKAFASAGMDYRTDVFVPQVNSYRLRAEMLDNNQVNAAVLPEPYATLARQKGHRRLYSSVSDSVSLNCLVFRSAILSDTLRRQQVQLLVKAYNRAVEELNAKGKAACSEVLFKAYRLPQAVIDSLRLPKFVPAAPISAQAVQSAAAFLREDERFEHYVQPQRLVDSTLLSTTLQRPSQK